MGVFDFLFGEGPSVDTQILDTLTPEQQQSLNQLLKELGGASPEFGQDGNIESSDLQSLSLQGLEDRAIALSDPNRENELASSAAETLMKLLDFENQDVDVEDFFQSNIRDPALKDFQENILPGISRSFGGANFFSSERSLTDQNAQEEIISSLTRARSDITFQGRENNLNRALQALGLSGQVDALGRGDTQELLALFGAGQEETALGERNFSREFDRFLANQGVDATRRAQLLSAIGTPAFENVVTTNPGTSGFLPTALGAMGAGGIGELLKMFGGSGTNNTNDTKIGTQIIKPPPPA